MSWSRIAGLVCLQVLVCLSALAEPVTVRIVDQNVQEHTKGGVTVYDSGNWLAGTVSGGTLDLTRGATYTFVIFPSARNSRAGEQEGHSAYLSRSETLAVPLAGDLIFVWNRALWDHIDLVDQNAASHSLATFAVSYGWNARVGDEMRVPVTTDPGTNGAYAGGYSVSVVPSGWNSRTGERLFESPYLSRVYTRPVSSEDTGVFRWDRAVWNPIKLVDQDEVSHSLARLSASGAWYAYAGDEMRVPVTTDPGTSGAYAAGYTVTVSPSSWNSRTGERWVNSYMLTRTYTRPVSAGTDGVFTWDRAVWDAIDLVDQDQVSHSSARLYSSDAWYVYAGDSLRVPVTEGPGITGRYATGYTVTVSPSAWNSRTGERWVNSYMLTRTYTRPVSVGTNGIFTWDRAVWDAVDLLDQDGVSHSLARFNSSDAWRARVGDQMRVPVTTGDGITGRYATGYTVTVSSSASNSRTGERWVNSYILTRTYTRPVVLGTNGLFNWDRAVGLLLAVRNDVDLVPNTIARVSDGWDAVHGDTVRFPVTEGDGITGGAAPGYDIVGRTGDTGTDYSIPDAVVVPTGFKDPAVFFIDGTKYELILGALDSEAPATEIALHGAQGENGWFTSDVTVTITATDLPEQDPVGVAEIRYALDGGPEVVVAVDPPAPTASTSLILSTDGIHAVSASAVDAEGNAATAAAVEVRVDRTAPTVEAGPNQTVEQAAAGGTEVTLHGSATDTSTAGLSYEWLDGGNTVLGTEPTLTGTFGPGTHVLTLSVDDDAGNTGADTVTVVVQDTTPPVLTVPADVTAEQTSPDGTPVNIGQATATDAGDADVAITNDAPAAFPLGTTVVTWTAEDDSGNSSTATQLVIVVKLPVTVRIVDQDGVEHTRGGVSASGVGSTTSGGTLDLTRGAVYAFVVVPSSHSSGRGEERMSNSYLSRTYTDTVPSEGDVVLVWDRAVWDPIDLVDQDGVRHSRGYFSTSPGHCWSASVGDVMRIPVTTDPDTVGDYRDGYPVAMTPSAWNSRLGEQHISNSYLKRTERRAVSLGTSGVFRWDRAVWEPIDLVDQDGVRHSRGYFSTSPGHCWSASVGDVMRIPVTTDPGIVGGFENGYPVRLTPSAWNSNLGEQYINNGHLRRIERRAVSLETSGVFRWDRAVWDEIDLVDQDGVRHSWAYFHTHHGHCWKAAVGDRMRIPVTTDPDIDGDYEDGYPVTIRPSAWNSRLGEQYINNGHLRRIERRAVSLGTSGVFRWDRAVWDPIDLVDQDGVPHSLGYFSTHIGHCWSAKVGDELRVPVTTDPDIDGDYEDGYPVRIVPSAWNSRLGEQGIHGSFLFRTDQRPVSLGDDGVFNWDRAYGLLRAMRNDVDLVPDTTAKADWCWDAVHGDLARFPVTEGDGVEGRAAPGYDIVGRTGDTHTDYSVPDAEIVSTGFNTPAVFYIGDTKYELIFGSPDSEAPATEIALHGAQGENGWFASDVTATITATDLPEQDPVGVAEIHYALDGAPEVVVAVDPPTAIAGASLILSADGIHTVSAWAVDAEGNAATPAQVEVRVDKTAPTVEAGPNQTVEQATAGGTEVTLHGSATDTFAGGLSYEWLDAGDTVLGTDPTLTRTFTQGTHVLTLSVDDDAGNTGADTVTVVVKDTTPPVLTVPADVTAEQASPEGTPVDIGQATAIDACDPDVTITNDAPAVFPPGQTVVIWTAVDDSGNKSTAPQAVTMVDTTPPVLTVPADVTAEQTNPDGTPVDIGQATATDNGDPDVAITHDAPAAFPPGATVVTWTATDDSGNATTGTQTVTVVDTTEPELLPGVPGPVAEGELLQSTGSFTDPGGASWTATVDYGDGTGVQPLPLAPDSTFELVHVYADDQTYPVTVSVTDAAGNTGTAQPSVTVTNAAPTVEAGEDQTIDESEALSLDPAMFNDLGTLDTHTATVDWGDGTPPEAGVVAEAPFGPPGSTAGMDGEVRGSHVYADNGVYTLTVTVTDDDGGIGSDTLTVTVHNVLPNVDAGLDLTAFEDTAVELDAAGFIDPGVEDLHTATIDWGDGTPPEDGIVLQGAGSGSVTGDHVFPEVGVYTVIVSVADDDEPANPVSDSLQVTVVNGFAAFGVFAQSRDVKLDDGGVVEGSVGSQDKVDAHKNSLIAGDLVSVRGKTHIHQGARVSGSVNCGGDVDLDKLAVVERDIVSGDDVKLKKDSLVQGDVSAADRVDLHAGATVGGTVREHAPYRPFPQITFVELDLEAGDDDVKVKKGRTLDLEPGVYGKLKLEKDATLCLGDGFYAFESIKGDKDACIHMDLTAGSIVIDVVKDVDMKEGVSMSASYSEGGSAAEILVQIQGKHVSFGKDATILGTFLGPKADIHLKDDSVLTGALYGKKVHLHKRSQVIVQPASDLLISLFVQGSDAP